jgi:membrane protein implicated in regulation of membrane protease activity
MLRAVAEARATQRRIRSLAKLNLELAKVEAQQKARALGIAAALGVVALAIVLYAVGFGFAAVAAALDLALPLWASLLIVVGAMLLAAVILALVAMRFVRKALPPEPSQAIEEGQRTIETVKSHV